VIGEVEEAGALEGGEEGVGGFEGCLRGGRGEEGA